MYFVSIDFSIEYDVFFIAELANPNLDCASQLSRDSISRDINLDHREIVS